MNKLDAVWMRNWWVVAFLLCCYVFYERGMLQRDADYSKLLRQYKELQIEEKKALARRQDLLLQINSQSDPAWVELTLMKGLGLVPEGQTKVMFK